MHAKLTPILEHFELLLQHGDFLPKSIILSNKFQLRCLYFGSLDNPLQFSPRIFFLFKFLKESLVLRILDHFLLLMHRRNGSLEDGLLHPIGKLQS